MRWLPCALGLLSAMAMLVAPARAAAAQEKRFSLPSARVAVDVLPTGAVRVTEAITYDFQGSFSGAYRDVPLRTGETMSGIAVSEGRTRFKPGGSPKIGTPGPARTFATTTIDGGMRVVWRFAASDERRTFTVRYVLKGLAVAYDDVVDVNLKVWGSQWQQSLERLDASMRLPGRAPGELRVWGHPASVKGSTALARDGSGATLRAERVPSKQFVELRMLFPRRLLESPSDARPRSGSGLARIVGEEQAAARRAASDEQRVRWLRRHAVALIAAGLLLAIAAAALLSLLLWLRYGREPRVRGVPEILGEPPGDEPPALAEALIDASGKRRLGGTAFPATLFDLIRRHQMDTVMVSTERRSWGGLRSQTVSELAVRLTPRDGDTIHPFEQRVLSIVRDAMDGQEWLLLSDLRQRVTANRSHYATQFRAFESELDDAISERGWWNDHGRDVAARVRKWAWIAVVPIGVGAWLAHDHLGLWQAIWIGGLAGVVAVFALLVGVFLARGMRRAWERRSDEGAQAAARWQAFRRFLAQGPSMREAVPGSVAIWERYLCYAIAFGVAERVLEAARLALPAEQLEASTWMAGYVSSPGSYDDLSSVSSVSVPAASSSSTGGGGGFSGGGGDGGGGGGGGAW